MRRREACAAIGLMTLAGCKRGEPPVPLARGSWGGLDGFVAAPAPADRGGPALVLLHGFSGRPEQAFGRRHDERWQGVLRDLVTRRGVRVFLPAGLEPFREGRAWWGGDGHYWPAHAADDGGDAEAPATLDPPVAAARAAIQRLLAEIRSTFAPTSLVLAGYSQGAMLALDVALARNPPVDRLVVVAGRMLATSLAGLRAAGPRFPAFFAHGREDKTVPFSAGKGAAARLTRQGHPVTLRAFDGGHRPPPRDIFAELATFVAGRSLALSD